jgi:hypothetical protein
MVVTHLCGITERGHGLPQGLHQGTGVAWHSRERTEWGGGPGLSLQGDHGLLLPLSGLPFIAKNDIC